MTCTICGGIGQTVDAVAGRITETPCPTCKGSGTHVLWKDNTRSDWDDEADELRAYASQLQRSVRAWGFEAIRLAEELEKSKDETEKAKAQRDSFRDELDKVSGALRRASA